MNTFSTLRQAIIEFHLISYGQIHRRDLVQICKISEPAATKDLATYVRMNPNNTTYDPRQRVYRRHRDFRANVIHSPKLRAILTVAGQMLALVDPNFVVTPAQPPTPKTVQLSSISNMIVALMDTGRVRVLKHIGAKWQDLPNQPDD